MDTVEACRSSEASEVMLLLERFEVPAPGLWRDARGLVLIERVRAMPLGVEVEVGVDDARGEVELESGVGLRPGVVPAVGFFVTADMMQDEVCVCATIAESVDLQ